ncbi:MAG: 3-dehydroquinate synthase [Cyanobacteria bacterium REEB65]|nr:3-dehydroquinate synthase [Cyanobacteria bacterium REEB65]
MLFPRNLVLAGFMGAGKTTVGRALAGLLGWRFVDLDEQIARAAKRPVDDLFSSEGEAGFRKLEGAAIADLEGAAGVVLATGGGAVIAQENRNRLSALGPIVHLRAPARVLWQRARGSDRPLARDRTTFLEHLAARRQTYRALPYAVDAFGRSPVEIAQEIADRFVFHGAQVEVALAERSYSIAIAPGTLGDLGSAMAAYFLTRRCLVVSQTPVWRRFGESVETSLRLAGWDPAIVLVPGGEGAKSLSQAKTLYQALLDHSMERQDPVIALGGGVVGDLAGFVAATYLRGVPFVQVPTTLLAQIDSSVGGKVAVNLPEGKNLIGAFHQPTLVLSDPLALATLPGREFAAGLAELIKYGMILDAELFERIEKELDSILSRHARVLVPLIARACELKAQIVAADERESGQRQILNFGHTLGHAIEAVAGYGSVLHGEAVAIGMVFATRLAERLGRGEPGLADRLEQLLARAGLPSRIDLPTPALLAAMAHDKKATGGRIAWILPERLGAVATSRDVDPAIVTELLRAVDGGFPRLK